MSNGNDNDDDDNDQHSNLQDALHKLAVKNFLNFRILLDHVNELHHHLKKEITISFQNG